MKRLFRRPEVIVVLVLFGVPSLLAGVVMWSENGIGATDDYPAQKVGSIIGTVARFDVYAYRDGDDTNLALIEANSFSIPADCRVSFRNVSAYEDLVLDDTTSITDGTVPWQELLLRNGGSYDITVKNVANTDLGSGDVTLGPTDYLWLLWTGTTWERIGAADN